MNKEQKAAVVEEVTEQLKEAQAVFAVDYRGISVQQAADLRGRLVDADARFRVVKNRLTKLAVDKAGAEGLEGLLEGPTALTFVSGDAAVAAKVIATFRREHDVLAFKGGTMEGKPLSVEEVETISKLPARDVLHGQLVGVIAHPLTTLVRGLGSMVQGLAIQLEQIREQGLVSGAPPEEKHEAQEGPVMETAPPEDAPPEEAPAEEPPAEEPGDTDEPVTESEAPGDPVAEGETAESESESEQTPSEGESK